jgi:branched-chain amino acid transport system permease protein
LCFTFWVTLGWPIYASAPAALVCCAIWGAAVERIAVQPFLRRKSDAWLMATVALGLVLENIVLFTFGKDPRGMPAGLLTAASFDVAGLKVQLLQIVIPLAGLSLTAVVGAFFQFTRAGKAALAVMQNAEAARLMGIRVEQVVSASFALSGALAGVAGILIAPLFTISSTMGTLFGIKAFVVAIVGGITSAYGVVLAGLLYGLAEAIIISLFGSASSQILTFALVLAVLALAPNGLFGRAAIRKV